MTYEGCVSALGLRDELITAAFARNFRLASAEEMSPKNARAISSSLKDVMVETVVVYCC